MLRTLLAERFQLQVHHEMREVPMYALVVAKNGPKLKEWSPDTAPMGRITGDGSGMHMEVSKGAMAQLASRLSSNGAGRPVIDKTDLTGVYSYKLDWVNAPGSDSELPSLVVALQEQLGLKLEAIKGMSDIIVIDRAERPCELKARTAMRSVRRLIFPTLPRPAVRCRPKTRVTPRRQ
jgi:uncharacterized protein (TIGR03435 family)